MSIGSCDESIYSLSPPNAPSSSHNTFWQEETVILSTELTSLQQQHSTLREDSERRVKDMEVMIAQHQQQSEAWEVEKQSLNNRIVTLESQLQEIPTRKRKGDEVESGEGESEGNKENSSEESQMKKAKMLGTIRDNKEATST